jgi:hypothetical protein
MDMFYNGGAESASKALQKALEKSKQQAMSYMQPYFNAGKEGLGAYQQGVNQMADPSAFYEKVLGNYDVSPAAKFRLAKTMDQLKNASYANGMYGSGAQRQGEIDYANEEIGADQQNYLNNILGIFGNYLTGQNNLANYGYNAGNNLASLEQNYGQQEAQAKMQQELAANQKWQQHFATGLNMAGNYMMGGGGFGAGNNFNSNAGLNSMISPYTSMGQARLSGISKGYY